jgi:hypothetical protein
MAAKRRKRPRDPIQLAKLIGDIATKQTPDAEEDSKSRDAVEFGREGGKVGGKARAASLTPEKRSEIARLAAQARWKKSQAASPSS